MVTADIAENDLIEMLKGFNIFETDGVNEKHLLYNHTKSYPCTAN